MRQENTGDSLETLREIRNIMERSARFLSLSGWSGVWAGCTALAGAYLGYKWLALDILSSNYIPVPVTRNDNPTFPGGQGFYKLLLLAIIIFFVALAGGYYFTWRKARRQGGSLWNAASRSMLRAMAFPMLGGAILCLGFMRYGHIIYIAPTCLIFYGLALYNGSRYTLSEIGYLGMLEVALGSICLFMPAYGLYFWVFGFGVLHIFYGIIMWNKYDKRTAQ